MDLQHRRLQELKRLGETLKAFEPIIDYSNDTIMNESDDIPNNLYNAIKEIQLSRISVGKSRMQHLAKSMYWLSQEMKLEDGE